MQQNKKWLTIFLTLTLSALLVIAVAVIYIDPFFQYHKPLKSFPYKLENQLTQNPGMAKNFEYDSVLLGSSMVVRFDTNWFRDLMDLNTIKLPYNAAYPQDQDTIMELIDESGNDLKAVFLAIDVNTYCGGTDTRAYPLQAYLYDDDRLNDVEYLWNKDVLINYILLPVAKPNNVADEFNRIYSKYYNPNDYATEIALASYTPSEKSFTQVPREEYIPLLEENMKIHILPYIEKNSDTKYYIFFPPYSILFWHDALQKNNVEARMAEYEKLVEILAPYDNVEMYFFAGMDDIICNLDNYTDYTHYSEDICYELTEYMRAGTDQITLENYKDKISHLQNVVETFDFTMYGL